MEIHMTVRTSKTFGEAIAPLRTLEGFARWLLASRGFRAAPPTDGSAKFMNAIWRNFSGRLPVLPVGSSRAQRRTAEPSLFLDAENGPSGTRQ